MRRIGELVDILRHKPYPEKLKAIEELKSGQSSESASVLVTALYDGDTRVTTAASAALVSLGEKAINSLTSALKTSDRNVRRNILLILVKIAEDNPSLRCKIEEVLIHCLKDPDPVVKAQAGENLGKMKSKKAIPHILLLLTDINFWVRSLAALVLGELGLTADEVSRKELVDALIERLNDVNYWVRRSACESLGKLQAREAVAKLSELTLNDPVDIVSDTAIDALKAIGEVSITPYQKALLSPDIKEQMKTIETLIKEGEAAVSALLGLLASEDAKLKTIVCFILGKIGSPKTAEYLLQLLCAEGRELRISAINALSQMKKEKVVKNLVSLLSHPDPVVSDGAKVSLDKMGEYVVPFLMEELTNQDPQVRMKICEILGNIGTEQATDALIKRLSDENPWVRVKACEALGKIGGEKIIPQVIIALKDTFYLVRTKACEALRRLRAPPGIGELTALLKDEEFSVRIEALKTLTEIEGERAKPAIIEVMNDKNIEMRVEAIRALARLKAIEILPLLEKIAQPWPFSREDDTVKEVARQAIKKFKELIASRQKKRL